MRFPNSLLVIIVILQVSLYIVSKFQIPPLRVNDFLRPELLRDAMDDIVSNAQKKALCGKQLTKNGTPEKLEKHEQEGKLI
jgi:hypothetical protein